VFTGTLGGLPGRLLNAIRAAGPDGLTLSEQSDHFSRNRTAAQLQAARTKLETRNLKANAFAERWVRTDRHELLDRTIIWNERQLRVLVEEYHEHYNTHRPHRSLNQCAPDDLDGVARIGPGEPIRRDTTCGGLVHEYHHAA
jgi:transposase InsO family protein